MIFETPNAPLTLAWQNEYLNRRITHPLGQNGYLNPKLEALQIICILYTIIIHNLKKKKSVLAFLQEIELFT